MTDMYSRKDTAAGRVDADYATWARAVYNYDATGQLATTTIDNVTTSAVVYTNWTDAPSLNSESYTYDSTGNRVTANGDTYTTGDANQLLCDGTYTYTYDANGNRTMKFVWTDSDTDGVVDDGERSAITVYAWDSRNRLASVTTYDDDADRTAGTSSSVVSYAYDYRNQMISRVVDSDGASGNATVEKDVFVYDGGEIVLEFTHSGSGEAVRPDLSERYLWDSQAVDHLFADEAVEWDSNAGKSVTDEVLWALVDHQNTIRDLAAYDSGADTTAVANHRIYDAYGNLSSETAASASCVFGYTGRYKDSATGLQNNLNRWYDSSTGRWISEDPIGYRGGINLYEYCDDNPLTHTDPQGTLTCQTTFTDTTTVTKISGIQDPDNKLTPDQIDKIKKDGPSAWPPTSTKPKTICWWGTPMPPEKWKDFVTTCGYDPPTSETKDITFYYHYEDNGQKMVITSAPVTPGGRFDYGPFKAKITLKTSHKWCTTCYW